MATLSLKNEVSVSSPGIIKLVAAAAVVKVLVERGKRKISPCRTWEV